MSHLSLFLKGGSGGRAPPVGRIVGKGGLFPKVAYMYCIRNSYRYIDLPIYIYTRNFLRSKATRRAVVLCVCVCD